MNLPHPTILLLGQAMETSSWPSVLAGQLGPNENMLAISLSPRYCSSLPLILNP